MATKKEYVNHKKYGRCLSLTDDRQTLTVTADLGPRIVYYGLSGGKNVLFEDINDRITLSGEYLDKNFREGETWHLYGGHRLWKSPEDFASYAPDNYPVEIQEIENGAVFTPAPEKMSGLQKTLTIEFLQDKIRLRHTFKNVSGTSLKASLWAVTALAPGGTLTVPVQTGDTGWLPNRNLVLWSYSDLYDERLTVSNDKITLRGAPDATKAVKFGLRTEIGKAEYVIDGVTFTKTFPFDPKKEYPDFSCNFEAYTAGLMLEAESLSPLYELNPGETAEHTEFWSLKENNQ